jgi:ceramide glucosyltransferase
MLEQVLSASLSGAGWLLLAMAVCGILYCSATVVALRRFFRRTAAPPARRTEAVTLLKPLCGAEPRLEQNLRTFVDHAHGGPVQILCGYAMMEDGAAHAVAALKEERPEAHVDTVISAQRHGPSGKISNLVNLHAQAEHPIVVMSDSDMAVGPDYLSHVLEALDGDGIGAVSLLYRGRGDAGFWSRLGAAGISYQFLPNAVFGVWSGLAAPCMGSTIAMRGELLERIGGLGAFADQLADDYAIGEAVRREGLKIAVPPHVITHACAERTFGDLWRHELRWGVTVRGVVLFSYLGSVITYPLPLAILGTLLSQQFGAGCALAGAALLIRSIQTTLIDRRVGAKTAPLWWIPLRDGLSFAVFVASLFARRVDWRGSRHHVHPRGRLATDQEYPA